MRIIAVISARMGSTRLPGKILMPLYGQPILQRVINAVKNIDVDDIILLTTSRCEDDLLAEWGWECGVKTHRYNGASLLIDFQEINEAYEPDYILRICGDQPFVDVKLCNRLIKMIRKKSVYDYYSYQLANGKPVALTGYGIFPEIFRYPTEDELDWIMMKKDLDYHQHFTNLYYINQDIYNCYFKNIPQLVEKYPFKATIDTRDDLLRVRKIVAEYGRFTTEYGEIVNIILRYPELAGDCFAAKYDWVPEKWRQK